MKGGAESPKGVENLHLFLEVDEQLRAQIHALEQERQVLLQQQQRIRDEEAVLRQRLEAAVRRAAQERSRIELQEFRKSKKNKSNKSKKTLKH